MSLVLLLGFQLSHAQLSRTHYIPPISAADNSNATPQNQYLHISTPSLYSSKCHSDRNWGHYFSI